MQLHHALEESHAIAEELLALVDLPLCNDSDRVAIADVACSLAFEHWHSLRLLLQARLLPSALVVHRSQFEAVLRSVWLTYAASDPDVSKLTASLDLASEQSAKNVAQAQLMMEALDKSGPKEAHAALARFKDNSWKALNSYATPALTPFADMQTVTQSYSCTAFCATPMGSLCYRSCKPPSSAEHRRFSERCFNWPRNTHHACRHRCDA